MYHVGCFYGILRPSEPDLLEFEGGVEAEICPPKVAQEIGGGVSVASGSGERGAECCGRATVACGLGARSCRLLVFTKPKPGRRGARGAGWQSKCPFWMSSTQWGRMMAAGDEGAVAGTVGQTKGTADTLLWASYSGIRAWGSHLQSREAPRPHSVHLRLRFRVTYQSAAASSPYEFFLFALPPTQEMGCSHTGGSQWPAGAGSGVQSAVAVPRWPAASERALVGY